MVKIISCLIHFLHTFRKLLYKSECFLLRFLPSDPNPSSSSDAYRRFKVHSLPVLEPEHLPIPFDQAKAAYELKHNKPLKPVFRHAGKTYPPQGTVGPVGPVGATSKGNHLILIVYFSCIFLLNVLK